MQGRNGRGRPARARAYSLRPRAELNECPDVLAKMQIGVDLDARQQIVFLWNTNLSKEFVGIVLEPFLDLATEAETIISLRTELNVFAGGAGAGRQIGERATGLLVTQERVRAWIQGDGLRGSRGRGEGQTCDTDRKRCQKTSHEIEDPEGERGSGNHQRRAVCRREPARRPEGSGHWRLLTQPPRRRGSGTKAAWSGRAPSRPSN